jgi:hypothetical protein
MASKPHLKPHRFADKLPPMSAEELTALAASIRENGQRQDIVLYQGQILDGRHRYQTCLDLGVEPRFVTHEGDDASALALVLTLNIDRRDLTASQRAVVAAEFLEEMPERRGGDRTKGKVPEPGTLNGRSRDDLAERFKVGKNLIQQAKALLAEAPLLARQVKDRTATLTEAYDELKEQRAEAARKARDAEKVRQYQEAIDAGEMTFAEALEKAVAAEREEREAAAAKASSRHSFHKKLEQLVTDAKVWIGSSTDDYLRSLIDPEAEGAENTMTAARLHEASRIFARLADLWPGDDNGQAPRPAARPGRRPAKGGGHAD